MSERLTRDELGKLRIWLMADSPARLHRISQRRIVADLLRLHGERERLRNLQEADVTKEQRRQCPIDSEWRYMHKRVIADVVRVMLGGDNNAST